VTAELLSMALKPERDPLNILSCTVTLTYVCVCVCVYVYVYVCFR
jgi:hypothetical protein